MPVCNSKSGETGLRANCSQKVPRELAEQIASENNYKLSDDYYMAEARRQCMAAY